MLLDGPGLDCSREAAHIAPRREHNPFAPRRPNTLHCYGVDFLSNKEVLDLFAAFKPQEVEWLDDSACNVVFEGEDVPQRVLQELGGNAQLDGKPEQEHWTVTKPLTVGQGQGQEHGKQQKRGGGEAQEGKAKQRATLREFRLEIRIATEADRKDPGHSGHTDSTYYAFRKEQQALQRQAAEMRRLKKRQRRSRFPSTEDAARPAEAAEAATPRAGSGATSAAGEATAAVGSGQLPRLGCRGLLDPLLFLRVSSSGGAGGPPDAGSSAAVGTEVEGSGQAQRKSDDLLSALRRAEAEYAAVLHPAPDAGGRSRCRQAEASTSTAAAAAPKGSPKAAADAGTEKGEQRRGRPRSQPPASGQGRQAAPGVRRRNRTPVPGAARERSPPPRVAQEDGAGKQEQRGRKRRPVEQEPRTVSSVGPAPRKVAALKEVEAFLSKHRVKCQRYRMKTTFRSIKFGQTKKNRAPFGGKPPKADAPMDQAPEAPVPTTDEQADKLQDTVTKGKMCDIPGQEELPPWDRYMQVNSHFTQQGHFMHTVAWEVEGRQILTVIPHPTRVDLDRLARAVQKPRSAMRLRKLKDIQTSTGWPVFVCPPVGHPKDAQGREPMLLVDSSAVELQKPLLFDCGTVGLSIPVSEFLRSTGAACVEGLGKTAPVPVASAAPVPIGLPTTLAPGGGTVLVSPEPAPEPGPTAATPQANSRGTGNVHSEAALEAMET